MMSPFEQGTIDLEEPTIIRCSGVGLDIHEAPAVGSTSADTLAAGHVVTVEPGVYLPDHGGVRIEDTVVVTHDGCLPLTASPKELILQ
jgi:Xaa-Pro aminopeptidase